MRARLVPVLVAFAYVLCQLVGAFPGRGWGTVSSPRRVYETGAARLCALYPADAAAAGHQWVSTNRPHSLGQIQRALLRQVSQPGELGGSGEAHA